MAGGIQPPSRGSRRRAPVSDINVTPLVDVMLVLLVVFMVAAPLMTVGVPVDLPDASAENIADPSEPLVVTVDANGVLYLQETQVTQEEMIKRLQAIMANKPDSRIFIRGDQSLQYGKVMEVMGHLNEAGLNKVALITDAPR